MSTECLDFYDDITRKYFKNKKVLLIGSGGVVIDYVTLPDIFIKNGAKSCEYLEVWEGYIDELKKIYEDKELPYKITHGNVKDIRHIFHRKIYDIIVWSHGPEHITFEDFELVFDDLCSIAKDLILLAVPYGSFWDFQKSKRDNPYETHIQKSIQEDTFDKFGFNKKIIGKVNEIGGNIFLWKEL